MRIALHKEEVIGRNDHGDDQKVVVVRLNEDHSTSEELEFTRAAIGKFPDGVVGLTRDEALAVRAAVEKE